MINPLPESPRENPDALIKGRGSGEKKRTIRQGITRNRQKKTAK
jgi:hypothetical protein